MCFCSMTHSSDGSMLHCFLHGVIDLVLASGTGSSGAAVAVPGSLAWLEMPSS